MTIEKKIASLFNLTDENWQKHSNPLSVYSRSLSLPLLILAFWSRVWIGWYCLIPVSIAFIWIWINPRLFPAPKSTRNWASRAVFGERVWMRRKEIPVPKHHQNFPNILSSVAVVGSVLVIFGVYHLNLWMTIVGSVLIYAGKLWFLDRMVWLYMDMKKQNEEYESWSY